MGLLAIQSKKAGLFSNLPIDYRKISEESPLILSPLEISTQTSTQAIPDTTTGAGLFGFLKKTGQSIARGYGAVGQGIVSALTGGKEPTAFQPQGKIQEAIFGTKEPFSLQEVGEEMPFVPKGSIVAPFIGGLGVALDLVGGSGLKGLKGLTTALKNTKTVEEATMLMKGAGFADDVIKNYAPIFAKTTDAPTIEKGLLAAETMQNTTKVAGETIKIATEAPIRPVEAISATERGFITSVKEALPKAEKVGGQYVPRLTDDLAIKAKNLIASDIATAEKIALTRADDSAVAIASELIKKYGEDAAKAIDAGHAGALYDKAAEIANTLAPKLTEQGRAIQAASILGRLTPEGQLRFAAREIQKFNEANPLKKIPELTGEQSKQILGEMKVIREMTDGTEKAIRFQKLQDYIKDLVPTPLIKKVIAVWKAGLLTGIKTSGLNLFSNLSHFATETIKDIPASIVDSVASLFTGQRTKTFNLGGTFQGMKEGFEKGLRYFKTGFDERNIAQKLDYHKVNFGKGAVAKVFQVYTDTVFRAMGSADQPFYYGTLARSLGDQALAKGMNEGLKGKELKDFAEALVQNPTEEMLRYAVADASTAVFQNQTYLGKAAKAIQNIPIVGEIVVPFGRTPSSVATQIINYTPIGTVAEIIKQIATKKFDQRLFSEAVGRGITGTAVLAIGVEMGKKGLIALDRPTTEKEQKLWELEGRKANSIYINGKWRSPIVLGPAGNLLLIGGHFNQAFQESGSPTEALANAVSGSAKSFTEQTFLTGINSVVSALKDPERFATGYLGQMVASTVPTIVSDVARATDPLERRTETIPQKIQARIPIARRELEPQIDVLGREKQSIGNPLEILADPTRPSPDISNPTIQELRRLTNTGFKVSPTLLGDKKGYKGLTTQENTRLWKRAGEITTEKLESLFSKETYQKLADDQKGKLVEMVVNKSKTVARAEAVIELTQGLAGEELKKKLSGLKANELLTREVFNKYQELR